MHRRLILLGPIVGLALSACSSMAPAPALAPSILAERLEVLAVPVPLRQDDPSIQTVGRLRYVGGFALRSRHVGFGGWSDLWVSPDGTRLWAISDEGRWLSATLDYDAKGRPTGLRDALIGRFRGLQGQPLEDKLDADAESLARLPDGSWLVGFEMRHRLLRYPAGEELAGGGLAGIPREVPAPAGFASQPMNGGVEAMAGWPDGRLVAVSEEMSTQPNTVVGWVGEMREAEVTWQTFAYRTFQGYRPTAAAVLPGGDLVLLERSVNLLNGWRVRVMRLGAADIRPGVTVQATELARLVHPVVVENFEGIAVSRGRNGETLLWMISDDNFHMLQQTLLLVFELVNGVRP